MKRLAVVVSALLASLAVVCVAPVGAQTVPPNLVGETIAGMSNATCSEDEKTLQFTASGVAFGPYSGSFVESGTFTFDTVLFSPTGFHATFTIFDLSGHPVVQGTKSFAGGGAGVVGCAAANSLVTYEATITPPSGGLYRDSGLASVSINNNFLFHDFLEQFFFSNGVLPFDTTGKATGGGRLNDVTKPLPVTFGFEVKQPQPGALQGRCLINDSASNTRVNCVDVTNYGQVGNTASWRGHAEVNGVVENYLITVQDNGEQNNGTDTFAFDSTSYHAAGTVGYGNIQLHKQA